MLTSEQHAVVPDELGSGGLQVEQDMAKWYQFEGFRAIKVRIAAAAHRDKRLWLIDIICRRCARSGDAVWRSCNGTGVFSGGVRRNDGILSRGREV